MGDRRAKALAHYERYEQMRVRAAEPVKPRRESRFPHYLAALYLWGLPVWITIVVIGLSNVDPETQAVPWYGDIAALILVGPIAALVFSMWWHMVARFSRNPIARFLFGGLTLLLMGSGIGILVDLVLYGWVMSDQPDFFTNEPLAPGPKRDAWLAARSRQQQTLNVDARQVHIHHH